jgi:hypothetical protein
MNKGFGQFLIGVIFILISFGSNGQVVSVTNPTNTTPNLAATYTTLANAITALNGITAISGPVVITLNAGNPQTAPAGGYIINFTATTTSLNNVTITGNNNTLTASNTLTAGSLTDAIFKIIGSDYVTIQHFTMQENSLNTTFTAGTNNMTEWGVALLYRSQTDGSQNNTIQNNTITLNKAYQNSFGIYSNTRHNSTNVTGTADITNNTTAPNSNNKFYGNSISNVNMGMSIIGSGIAANMDVGNDIGGNSAATGNSITNWGGALAGISGYLSNSGTFHGIFINNQTGENTSYNTITSATISGTTTTSRGIHKRYNTVPAGTFTSTITNNTITITNNNASGNLHGIFNEGITSALSTATININNNSFLNNSAGGVGSAIVMVGIINTSKCGILNINSNIIRGNTTAETTGSFTGISSTDSVQTTLNINNNQIGDALGNAITFSAINSGSQTVYGINAAAASIASVSISNNNFQGFVHTSPGGSWTHSYINLYHPSTSATTDNINGNNFTNITANTSGSVTFIGRTGAMALSAGAIENCSNNKIITAFSKPVAGGTVSIYLSTSTCLAGNTMVHTGNDFSNISLTGATTMNGWSNIEGGASGPTKTINTNIFKNWTCGTSPTLVIYSNSGGNNTFITGNEIMNIAGDGDITAINIGAASKLIHTVSNNIIGSLTTNAATGIVLGIAGGSGISSAELNITGNNIHSLLTMGSGQAEGIKITAAATCTISKNKLYDLSAQNVSGTVVGIDISTVTANAIYNISTNLVGDLTAPVTNNALAIRGISVSSAAAFSQSLIYYNTIHLNAGSSGTNFGTAALYLTASGTATTSAAILQNNIFSNTSTANGTGLTVSYRRSGAQLANYVLTSNNNLFYAGNPSAERLIYFDGTNSDQTLASFKTRVSARESASFTEAISFLSTSGASANFLHLDPVVPTQAESGAVNIAGYNDDYDGDIRQGNAGYTGTGTAPDIGADEIEGIFSEAIPPVISYSALSSPTCTFSGRVLSGVNITDATGVPLSGATRPRIYYRKNAGTWYSQPGTNTSGTITNSNWDFTIVESDMGSLTGGEVISYYIIAQDLNPLPNVVSNPSAGLVATSVSNVTTHPTSPNTYTLRYNLNGTYTVGIGGEFTTLTAAVTAYNNACSLGGPAIFELIDNTYGSETFPIAINNHPDASAVNTLTIRPSATATPVITGSSASQIINLNGARYVSFDGRQAGSGTTKSLTLSNTNASGITVQFINDAQNDALRYCIIKGMRTSGFTGTVFFSTANASGTGNDNNTIDNNDITDAGGQPYNGICSIGTAGRENDNILITNNNISNYFSAASDAHGVFVSSNSSGWTISGNRLFQTATRVCTGASFQFGIYITTGTGYTISNNIIGFANASGTGTTNMIGNSVDLAGFPAAYTVTGAAVNLRYIGIGASLGLIGTATAIDGNTIGGFAMYTSSNSTTLSGMFCGIYIESGTANIGANAGNIIGAASGTNSIYVATSGAGGTIVGIRAACIGSVAIQNNTIGSITSSGNSAAVSGSFVGINIAGLCNFNVSNNSIGNITADNIRVGFSTSGANLSNTGTLTATNVGVTATLRGINSSSTGNILAYNNNTIRGWVTSCRSAFHVAIESAGGLSGLSPSVNANNNFLGTAAVNWINSTVDNVVFFYTINITNTGAATYNIKDNDIRGSFFGTQNSAGGSFLRLTGASSPNAVSTISGNTFTNVSFRLSSATLYFIFTSYNISATGRLIIDNNKIAGTLNSTGSGVFNFIHSTMTATSGAKADITNNEFSNITTVPGGTTDFYGIYTYFAGNPCILTVTGNKFTNWSYGNGIMVGIEISDMTGTATCTNNTITGIASRGDMEGISLSSASASGQFTISDNTVTGLVSSVTGGYIYGISHYLPPVSNTTQTTITKNTIGAISSTASGIITGIFLDNGHSSTTLTISSNKIYDISGTATGCRVYGITNHTVLAGNITYINNYIGDLRAPNVTLTGQAVTGIRLFLVSGQAKVYFNTIYLNATGSASAFSTAAVFADGASQVTLRNNIFINISTHGATGRTVAYWRGSTNLGTYDATSNHNLFYAGTPTVRDLVFYDGTNSDQTITAYQARVTPKDNLSVSGLPNFLSTTGSNVNFLHISPTGNCSVNARGNNAGILVATDYDNDSRSTVSPFVTDIGADEFSKKNVWTGANGTSWNDPGNWSTAVVPDVDDDNASISSPPVNQPVIAAGETFQVASLILGTGASLTNRGTLKVAGNIYGSPSGINNIQAGIVEGSFEMNGNCSIIQPVTGNVFVSNSVRNFKISNNVTISSLAGEHLAISRTLSFGAVTGKVLNTGDNLVLLSTATSTANIADVTGNSISGKATVERYIHTGELTGMHPKSWQFLATPAKGQSIYDSWQEGGTTPSGYGTIITGTGSGFDIATAQPSMKFYDPIIGSAGAWTGITNTGNQINDQRGYMVFVRGDRTVNAFATPPNPTNMRIKGTLYQPNDLPPVTTVLPGKLASVGNPYASAINIEYMKNNGQFVNLDNDVVVWDPLLNGTWNLGGYQTLSAANNYEPTAGGTSYYPAGIASPVIQSGQAFFVRSSGPAGSVTFSEASKDGTNRLVNRNVDRPGSPQYFRARLFTGSGVIADGNAVVFDNVYRNRIDENDAVKLMNSGENFGLMREDKVLSVETRKKAGSRDTLFYRLTNLKRQPYQFRFAPKNMGDEGLSAYLVDQYKGTKTSISLFDTSTIHFTVNEEAASAATDRFYVIFRKKPHRFIVASLSAARNADHSKAISWNVSNESGIAQYEVERSFNGTDFEAIASKPAQNNNGALSLYDHQDNDKGKEAVYYRVAIIQEENEKQFTEVVRLAELNDVQLISIYPNPVVGKKIQVHFQHMPVGDYSVRLTSLSGQQVFQASLNLTEGNMTRVLDVTGKTATGNYQLTLTGPGNKKTSHAIFIK